MPVNSYRDDEKTIEVGKMATLGRLFKYLLAYKLQIVGVLFIMGFCVVVTLLNPLSWNPRWMIISPRGILRDWDG